MGAAFITGESSLHPKRSNNPATDRGVLPDGSKENVRAYICRSFSEPVWVDLCTNSVMQRAVLMAQVEGMGCSGKHSSGFVSKKLGSPPDSRVYHLLRGWCWKKLAHSHVCTSNPYCFVHKCGVDPNMTVLMGNE